MYSGNLYFLFGVVVRSAYTSYFAMGTIAYWGFYFSHIKRMIMTDEEILSQIESLMERWLHGRDNNDETLENIKELLINNGYLNFWK
jgi:hypothetical protein